jgi:L-fuconolactonase
MQEENVSAVIDAHQHCWRLGHNDCSWPTAALAAIYRDFTAENWFAQAAPQGVTGSVLVQSQASERDSDYLLTLAERYQWILGVVGWLDLAAPQFGERIEQMLQRGPLCGLRPMLQNLDRDDWILQPVVEQALTIMAQRQCCFDALVYARHLPHIYTLARRYPTLSIVLDHAAKPDIGSGEWSLWAQWIECLAECGNVFCKLSGLVTEMDLACSALSAGSDKNARVNKNSQTKKSASKNKSIARYFYTALKPYVTHIYHAFGRYRIIWGSDWPVVNLATDYATWLAVSRQLITALDPQAVNDVFGYNALRFYRLEV